MNKFDTAVKEKDINKIITVLQKVDIIDEDTLHQILSKLNLNNDK